MIKRFFVFVSTLFLLVGCASVPDEVLSDMSNYYKSESNKSDDFDFTYVNVSELSKEAEEALSKNYGQFIISDKINFVQPLEINIMSFIKENNFSKYEEALSLFYTESEVATQDIWLENEIYFYNETDKLYCRVRTDGFIAMLNPETFDDIGYSAYDKQTVKIYHPDRNDDLSDEYQLKDGKCSVSDAVDYINNWIEANYKPLAPYYDYQVNTVIVKENEGNYFYQFKIEALYNGVPLDSHTMEAERINGQLTLKMAYLLKDVSIQMINVNSIDSFTTGDGTLIPKAEKKISECISLESALKLCKRTFTEFEEITISDIDVIYTLIPVYETDAEGNDFISEYSSRPVWEVVIDVPPEEFLAKGEVNTYGDIRKYIYIDMVTGEIKYNFDIVKQY